MRICTCQTAYFNISDRRHNHLNLTLGGKRGKVIHCRSANRIDIIRIVGIGHLESKCNLKAGIFFKNLWCHVNSGGKILNAAANVVIRKIRVISRNYRILDTGLKFHSVRRNDNPAKRPVISGKIAIICGYSSGCEAGECQIEVALVLAVTTCYGLLCRVLRLKVHHNLQRTLNSLFTFRPGHIAVRRKGKRR